MKKSFVFLILLICLMSATFTFAATVENRDSVDHRYQIVVETNIHEGILNRESKQYGICNFGCTFTLDNGETIELQPNDSIVIENGKIKASEF